jgi:hypothetical protein
MAEVSTLVCPHCRREISGVSALTDRKSGITTFFCPECRCILGASLLLEPPFGTPGRA